MSTFICWCSSWTPLSSDKDIRTYPTKGPVIQVFSQRAAAALGYE